MSPGAMAGTTVGQQISTISSSVASVQAKLVNIWATLMDSIARYGGVKYHIAKFGLSACSEMKPSQ